MNSFNNEDTFFELTQKAEQEEKDQHLQKCRVIHLWGAAYYDKDEAEYYGSRNKAGEHYYDEKILSFPAANVEIITTVVEYQKQQANKISK